MLAGPLGEKRRGNPSGDVGHLICLLWIQMEGGSQAWGGGGADGNLILAISTQLVLRRGSSETVTGWPSFLDDCLPMQEVGSQHRQRKSLVVGRHGKQEKSQRQKTL